MPTTFIHPLLVSILLVPLALSSTHQSPLPVCILGAGPSGLSAAHTLESLGRNVIIFEKQATVGGRAQNYNEGGHFYPLGPLLVSNASHPEVSKIIKDVSVDVEPFVSLSNYFFNWTTGETSLIPSDPGMLEEAQERYVEELGRYTAYWKEVYGGRFGRDTFTSDIPEELTVSTAEWFSRQDFPEIQSRFTMLLAAWGYGRVEDVPIFYTLSIFSPASIAGRSLNVVDFYEVFHRWSKQLASTTIHLSSTVSRIDRNDDSVTIHYTLQASSSPRTISCSDLILAFSPTLSSLHNAGLSLSAEETDVFSSVKTTNYFSAAVQLNSFPRQSTFIVSTESPTTSPSISGEPIFMHGFYNDSDISTAYSLARGDQSTEAVRGILLETISRLTLTINGSSEPKPTTFSGSDIRAFRQHATYFAHFDSASLREGMYELFNRLQGRNRTYFTSGLNRVEHVEVVVGCARDLMGRYFGDGS
ncbi:hypothetical protein BDW69DRAFT_182601 [Aspergillus filifer]